MNAINTRINLDLAKRNDVLPVFNAVQYDTKRTVTVVFWHSGVQYDLTGSTVRFYSQKSDGAKSYLEATKSGNKATVKLTNQTLAVAGLLKCMLEIRGATIGKLTTPVCNILVMPSIVDEDTIESSNEFTALDSALQKIDNVSAEFERVDSQLAETAKQSYVDTKFGSMGSNRRFMGGCTNTELLAKTGMLVDDYWYISDLNTHKCYNGTSWVDIGNNLKLGDNTLYVKHLSTSLFNYLKKFSTEDIVSSKDLSSVVASSIVDRNYKLIFSNTGYGGQSPIILKPDSYKYGGFSMGYSSSANLGLVFAKTTNGYLFMHLTSTNIGRIYSVVNKVATQVVGTEDTSDSSTFKSITINSIVGGILTYTLVSNNVANSVTIKTVDLSAYTIAEYCIGFIGYNSSELTITFPCEYLIPSGNYVDKSAYDTKIADIMKKQNYIKQLTGKFVNTSTTYKIKFIGDSITAGYRGTGFNATSSGGGSLIYGTAYQNVAGLCWANSLKSFIESKFSNVAVRNYGVSGATSSDLVNNLSSLIASDDNLIICMIGTNDRNSPGCINRLYTKLQAIYNYVIGLGKDIIFMSGIPASVSNETDTGTPKYMHMEDVDHITMSVASMYGLEYVSAYKLFIEYCESRGITIDSLLADGLHPSDAGYDAMFYLIANALGFGTKRPGATW